MVDTDERIGRARAAALDLLKPSRKDLEHGLELHAQSIVMDAYGFAPVFAWDADALRAARDAGAGEVELEDLCENMEMTRGATDAAERRLFLDAWDAAGVTCIFQNAGQEGMEIPRLLKRLAHFTYLTDMIRDDVRRAAVPEDIEAAKKDGGRCLYFMINGVPLPLVFQSVEEELKYVEIFFQLGARMAHLTYNRRNLIGDGCGEQSDGGLSDFGRAAIAEMNRVGMIVDVAHSGWRTSLEAARASARPMCASHTVACALNEHMRGKPDDVIRAIADTDGFVGICAIQEFLGRTGDIVAMLDHIDYVAKTFGADHVAIGTDRPYRPPHFDSEQEKAGLPPTLRHPWRHLWPEGCMARKPQWDEPGSRLSIEWTNWPMLTVGLVQRGYTDDDVRKIVAGNVLRVAKAAQAGVQ